MTITYSIDTTAGLVRLRYHENPTFSEWEATMLAVLDDPDFRPGFGILADRRGVPAPSSDYVRSTLDFSRAHPALSYSRFAIVVDGLAAFGMGRMGQILGDDLPGPISVFNGPVEAEEWLRQGQHPDRAGGIQWTKDGDLPKG
jgi:hypothetical protein